MYILSSSQPFVSHCFSAFFCSTEIGQISIRCDVAVQQFLSWTDTPVNKEVVRLAKLTFVLLDFFVGKNDI